jgi:hypothetical protein
MGLGAFYFPGSKVKKINPLPLQAPREQRGLPEHCAKIKSY